jgi:PAS domain S-box-containing protein
MTDSSNALIDWMGTIDRLPPVEQLIDRTPLRVTPETLVSDAIARMSQVIESYCGYDHSGLSLQVSWRTGMKPSSCVLVVEGSQLLGIFTERDLVKWVTAETNLSQLTIANVMSRSLVTLTLSATSTIYSVLSLFVQHRIRHLPVLDTTGAFMGLLTSDRIRQALEPTNTLRLRQIREVMSSSVIHATPNVSVLSLAQQMLLHQISCIVLVDETSPTDPQELKPVGIITERDIVQFQVLGIDLSKLQAATVMSSPLFCLRPTDSLWEAQQEMQQRLIRRVVVVGEQGELLGLVTETDLVRLFDPMEMAAILASMQRYIETKTSLLTSLTQQLQATQNQLEQRVIQRTQELAAAEEQFRVLATEAPVGIFQTDERGDATFVNPRWLELTGLSLAQAMGKGWSDALHPDDRDRVFHEWYEASQQGREFRSEYRFQTPQGLVRWVLGRAIAVRDATGLPTSYIGIVTDITERRLAEQKIRQQAALLDITSDAISVRTLDNQILYWNRGAERLYGWTSEEMLATTSDRLYPNPTHVSSILTQVIQQGNWQGELVKLTKAHQEVMVSSRWTLMPDEGGEPQSILVVETDITEKKQLEAQFLRAQRLENLGMLASGIAHDLNNLLTPILVTVQLLPLKLKPLDSTSLQLLHLVEGSVRQATDLVQQMLSFARGSKGTRSPVSIESVLQDIDHLVRRTFPQTIACQLSIPSGLGRVMADTTQLHQVVMNLCVNARDAMPQGGRLMLKAENVTVDAVFAQMQQNQMRQNSQNIQLGAYVMITIEDTGVGIAPEHLDRIFEPFFTTKAIGQGSGLGLSTVAGIVKNHGGFVRLSSQVGQGSSFQVYLPQMQPMEPMEQVAIAPPPFPMGQEELILVVDHELTICEIIKTTLETYHYRVIFAHNGVTALARYAQFQSEIRAVLIDLNLPRIDGCTTLSALQGMNPQLPIIVMGSALAQSGVPAPGETNVQRVLPKPFTSQELLHDLHEILRGEADQ